jgi:hypothetical protein
MAMIDDRYTIEPMNFALTHKYQQFNVRIIGN